MYSKAAGKQMSSIMKELEDLDARIGKACIGHLKNEPDATKKLAKLQDASDALHRKLSKTSYDIDLSPTQSD